MESMNEECDEEHQWGLIVGLILLLLFVVLFQGQGAGRLAAGRGPGPETVGGALSGRRPVGRDARDFGPQLLPDVPFGPERHLAGRRPAGGARLRRGVGHQQRLQPAVDGLAPAAAHLLQSQTVPARQPLSALLRGVPFFCSRSFCFGQNRTVFFILFPVASSSMLFIF